MRVVTQTVAMIAVLTGVLMAQVPTDGLVAFYPFTGNWNDASGNGNHLTTITQYAPTACADRNGVANQADTLNGANQGLHAPKDSFPMGASARTLSAWVQLPTTGTPKTIMFWGTTTAGNGCSFFARSIPGGGGAQLIFTNYSDSLIYTTIALDRLHSWTHLAVTLNASGNAVMYMGDSVIATKTMAGWNTSGGDFFCIGARFGTQYAISQPWGGKLDAVAVYDRALSASEISLLADNTTDQLITTRAINPATVSYSLAKPKVSDAIYSINGRALRNVSTAGVSVGAAVARSVRLR